MTQFSRFLSIFVCAVSAMSGGGAAGDPRYMDDYKFLIDLIEKESAALKSKKLDLAVIKKTMQPKFEGAQTDVDHVKNVMELLAFLSDSHTGVLDAKVDAKALPSKWDGLFGAGLWFGQDGGKFVLRGIMKDHPLEKDVPLGSVLSAIDGRPAWLAMETEKRRVAVFQGISSDHSFFASCANRMLPFGDRQTLELTFLLPDLDTKKVKAARWGPGGKAFYPATAFLPDGLAFADGAISKMIRLPHSDAVGYLKITGSMDDATAKSFDVAFDALKGSKSMILDCRGMGGGGDASAWRMNGRFFSGGVDNGRHGKIAASGDWQFDGPVVMLQDELEVSSAETFTWAMSETLRAVSIGRPTGGWGIIPKSFTLPSGLASFRLGVNDRPTPIRGIHTEGIGWAPDVLLPFGPKFSAIVDPERDIANAVLQLLDSGIAAKDVRDAWHALFEGDVAAFRAFGKKAAAKVPKFDADAWAKLVRDDLEGEIAMEVAALKIEDTPGDFLGASKRLTRLSARAKSAGVAPSIAKLEALVKSAKAEIDAQIAWSALIDPRSARADKARDAFFSKHGKTKLGRWLEKSLVK